MLILKGTGKKEHHTDPNNIFFISRPRCVHVCTRTVPHVHVLYMYTQLLLYFVCLFPLSHSRITGTSYCFDSVAPNALPAANIFVVAVLVCLSKYMM